MRSYRCASPQNSGKSIRWALLLTAAICGHGCASSPPGRIEAVEIYREAKKAFVQGDLEEARVLLDEAFQIAPDYAQLRRDLGMVNFELGKPLMFAALRHADAAERGGWLLNRFDSNNDGRVTVAELDITDLVFDADHSGSVSVQEESWANNLFGSVDYNENGSLEPADLELHRKQSDQLRRDCSVFYSEAKKHYGYAATHRSHEPMPHYNLARIYLFEGNLNAARRELQDALTLSQVAGDLRNEMEKVLRDIEDQIARRALTGSAPARGPARGTNRR